MRVLHKVMFSNVPQVPPYSLCRAGLPKIAEAFGTHHLHGTTYVKLEGFGVLSVRMMEINAFSTCFSVSQCFAVSESALRGLGSIYIHVSK